MFAPCLLPAIQAALFAAAPTAPAAPQADAAVAFFEKRVRPVLVGHCYSCHSAETKPAGGLRVDDRRGLLVGGNSGPAVVPGRPDDSLLIRRATHAKPKRQMPLEGKLLTERQIADLRRWVKDGAAWPPVHVPPLGKRRALYERLKREHWAWQPLKAPPVPAVKGAAWCASDVDRFVLAGLEARGLRPSAPAGRAALLRRVTFDLTGLPPSPAELAAFLADRRPDAFGRVVDRLLASPHFGERWGRHWLDLARYGESTGPSRNVPYPHAWRYRDYVLDAVNRDVPFNRFVTEQVAGDLLPSSPGPGRDRLLTATGFLALGAKDVNQRFKARFDMDNVDEQVDVVTRSLLALSVSCARCHDHKFAPVPTTDYYALAGIFASTDNCAGVRNKMGGGGLDYYVPTMLVRLSGVLPPPPAEQVKKAREKVKKAKAEWDAIRGTKKGLAKGPNGQPFQRRFRLALQRAEAELKALTDPAARGHAVHGVREAKEVGDTEVRVRGEAEKLGPVVPRGFLTAFTVPGAPRVNPRQSGRLELAAWLTSPKNPLTPRVLANRAWAKLFGRGIVSTVDDFGPTGDRPSHPELLDHLAAKLVAEGWSLKKLVRSIVLSKAYQLSAETSPANLKADPGNRLVWRHSPRRLDAEEFRDAMLAVAGTLDRNHGVGSAAQSMVMKETPDNGPEARALHEHADRDTHRSVYLPLVRGITPHALEAFDPVDQTLVTGKRDATTVPAQALFLLNSPFVRGQSLALARKLFAVGGDERARVGVAYRRALGREATSAEVERVLSFLAAYEDDYRKQEGRPAVAPRAAAWAAFAQALFAFAEFRYIK